MPRLNKDQWEEARALRETGVSLSEVAARMGVDRAAVSRRAKREKWSDGSDIQDEVRRRVAAKVTGIVTEGDPQKKAAAIDAEADKVVEVVRRHREETNAIRDRLYSGLKTHKAATTHAEKRLAFEDLKAAKISSECLQNIHRMERVAWGIEDSVAGKGEIKIRWAGGDAYH